MSKLYRFPLLVLLLAALPVAYAVPVSQALQDGVLQSGSQSLHLTLTLGGSDSVLSGYTIGVFDMRTMTADANDPDFKVQALNSDRVQVIHEFGCDLDRVVELDLDPGAQLGFFVLRGATLRDYSRGQAFYQPVFSVPGAPNGQYVTTTYDDLTGSLFYNFSAPPSGRVFGTASGASPNSGIQLRIDGFDPLPNDEPVVPEPATLALTGLGLAGLGCLRRRRAMPRG